ncbi:hypothetical protein SEUCBS139899_010834 [Sporothrix eucalyptigena]
MGNLLAIELGNEPEYFSDAGQEITDGISWTPAADAASQDNWDIWVGAAIAKKAIIQAGVWLSSPSTWGNAKLITTEDTTAQEYVSTYYHHNYPGGTVQGVYDVYAPYYGATAATAALAGASYIAPLDNKTTNYAAYTTYDLSGSPLRVFLYNSDYFHGAGTRSSQTFELTGLNANSVQAKRLTAANALSRVDQGSPPTWGGQEYTNGNCVVSGTETFETATVTAGAATFTLQAAEALLVNL